MVPEKHVKSMCLYCIIKNVGKTPTLLLWLSVAELPDYLEIVPCERSYTRWKYLTLKYPFVVFFFFFLILFYQGGSASQGPFFSCALSHYHNMSWFNSWLAGARVRFLPKETQQQPGIDPGHQTWNLANISLKSNMSVKTHAYKMECVVLTNNIHKVTNLQMFQKSENTFTQSPKGQFTQASKLWHWLLLATGNHW